MLPRRGRQQVVHGLEPETRHRAKGALGACTLALRLKDLLHLAAVLDSEVERQDTKQRAEDPVAS